MTSLAAAIRCAPIPHDAAQAAEAAEIFADQPGHVRDLLAGTAGCSGYLGGLMRREADWLREALSQPPGETLEALLAAPTRGEASPSLRRAKRRVALLTGLADLGGVWELMEVTTALTRMADRAVQVALEAALAHELGRGKLPGCREEDLAEGCGIFALAMGKMGAFELNYSSDIDLIMLFDEDRHDPKDYAELRSGFIRATQRMVKLLSETTAEGYVFRTDLRLRPDPSVTPVCIATDPAERYYESLGRTWERAAHIKARPCAGAVQAGWAYLDRLRPFVWRRHLDYAAIQDARDMILRIRSHKGLTGPLNVLGHDMKLGVGGIREIEFFAQTRQLITGGRDETLRDRGTLAALDALTAAAWVEPRVRDALAPAYVAHRTLEHRLQMLEDAQTHRMPRSEAGFARLADFCGESDRAGFAAAIRDRLAMVHELTEPFFVQDAPPPPPTAGAVFADAEAAEALMAGWRRLPAMRSERARTIFKRIEPHLLGRLGASGQADQALIAFDAFLSRLPAGVQVFSLFEANPSLLDLLVDICSTTPELARYLGRNAGVLDAVISRDFYGPLPGAQELRTDLARTLAGVDDYETALNRARVWTKERHFRIGVQLLRGLAEPEAAAAAYSNVADAVAAAVLPLVAEDIARRHGPAPGAGAAILAMGKLGSREMTATSDLDLIVLYDAEPDAMSEGRKPLMAATYYARLTQALIAALSAPMAEGVLYKVDMRLRPSGKQGPVATSLAAFARYQAEEAWTWEHLALTRARVVAGPPDLARRVTEEIAAALTQPHDGDAVLADVRDMRRRLAEANGAAAADPWETKLGPGRMMDIELLAQTGALLRGLVGQRRPRAMLDRLARDGWIGRPEAERLSAQLARLSALQQYGRLASDHTIDPAEGGPGLTQLVLEATGAPDLAAVKALLADEAAACAAIVSARLDGAAEPPEKAAAPRPAPGRA